MHTLILSDWNTIAGAGSGDSITQDELFWLDLEVFQDAIFWVECREATNAPTLTIESSPTKDNSLFQQVGSSFVMGGSSTPTAIQVLLATATLPLARYARWKITGGAGAWDATFRILVSANSPGM